MGKGASAGPGGVGCPIICIRVGGELDAPKRMGSCAEGIAMCSLRNPQCGGSSLGPSWFSWSTVVTLGVSLKGMFPPQVLSGSLLGLLVSTAGRALRAGVHCVPGFAAHCGPARLQGREGGLAPLQE